MQIIMLTVYQDNDLIFNALAAGATGYLLKRTPGAELIASIREVHAGGSPMSSHIARKVVQSFRADPAPAPSSRDARRRASARCSTSSRRATCTRRSRRR